jgi:polyphenol oxidase
MTPVLPALPAPFGWRAGQIAVDLLGGHAVFTTRTPGTMGIPIDLLRWSDHDDGAGPLDALAAEAGVRVERLAQSHQVHEARVRVLAAPADLDAPPSDYDAQVTTLRGVACVVRVADCLPVALIAPEVVGVAHAGWRGLAGGVLQATVATLRDAGASEIQAAIGPGARVCCYEVGDEVHAAFGDVGKSTRRGSHADLAAVATALLGQAGVTTIHDSGLCTMCAADGLLWSHRREGAAAGRQAGVAWRS